MATLPWMLIAIMTVACFALGALWHGPLFGKLWMRIHHGKDSFNAKEMEESMKGMWKLMLAEFVATFLMVMTLAFLMKIVPSNYSGMHIAFLVWIGFVLPTMTSTVIWGADVKKYMCTKIAVSSVCRLLGLLATGYVLAMW
jgi:glycerol uptake facilitator-like aquaporin